MKYNPLNLAVLVLSLICVVAASPSGSYWDHLITVDNVNGTHNESLCITGEVPCATLNMALRGLKNNTLIQVNPGHNYTLNYGMENNISNVFNVSIVGSGVEETGIVCEEGAGLYVSHSININIESITLCNCGYDAGINTRLMYKYTHIPDGSDGWDYDKISYEPAAITFSYCENVTVNKVAIQYSNGSGLLLHQLSGYVTITNSVITGGYSPQYIVGGLVITNDQDSIIKPIPHYLISQSNITYNNYTAIKDYSSIRLQGSAIVMIPLPDHITIDFCFISNNNRGLYIVDLAENDALISISNTEISKSNYSLISLLDNTSIRLKLFDVNITDSFIVNQERCLLDPNNHNEDNQIQNPLKISLSCSSNKICHGIPSTDFYYTNCITEDDDTISPGRCSDNNNTNYKGHCPIPYSVNGNLDGDGRKDRCWNNRHGDLCSKCVDNYSVAINSPYLSCVRCDGRYDVLKGWGLLLLLEFVPITIMVAVIALLNVNLTQGSLKSYIFYCQILTIPFPSVSYPSWFVVAYSYQAGFRNSTLLPLTIWNLVGFISTNKYCPSLDTLLITIALVTEVSCGPQITICISRHTTPLGAISFWYLIGFYPFLLLFLIYYCVIAYDKGYRCVVFVIRPIHRLLARFWRMFDIQPSLPTSIASVYTLCFTQLAATSLKLLHKTTFQGETVFFYDGSQPYFHGWHIPAVVLALIVLIVFIIVPVVYLSVYPFKWFQSCLNRVKIRKDLLISVTDVFTAPYSNGTQNTWDYRYMASSHFTLQLVVMMLYYIHLRYQKVIIISQISICFVFIMYLVIFRPYKRKSHTFIEGIIMFTLMAFSIFFCVVAIFPKSYLDSFFFNTMFFPVMLFLPFLAFCYCCFVWFPRKLKYCCCTYYRLSFCIAVRQKPPTAHQVPDDIQHNIQDQGDNEDDDLLPDRMANPAYYGSLKYD